MKDNEQPKEQVKKKPKNKAEIITTSDLEYIQNYSNQNSIVLVYRKAQNRTEKSEINLCMYG